MARRWSPYRLHGLRSAAWAVMVNGRRAVMAEAPTMADTIKINRAPVLTLWAAVVAERLGFDHDAALTLGQAVAGLSAYAKGVSLGIIEPRPELVREQGDRLSEGERLLHVDLLGRAVKSARMTKGEQGTPRGVPYPPWDAQPRDTLSAVPALHRLGITNLPISRGWPFRL